MSQIQAEDATVELLDRHLGDLASGERQLVVGGLLESAVTKVVAVLHALGVSFVHVRKLAPFGVHHCSARRRRAKMPP